MNMLILIPYFRFYSKTVCNTFPTSFQHQQAIVSKFKCQHRHNRPIYSLRKKFTLSRLDQPNLSILLDQWIWHQLQVSLQTSLTGLARLSHHNSPSEANQLLPLPVPCQFVKQCHSVYYRKHCYEKSRPVTFDCLTPCTIIVSPI